MKFSYLLIADGANTSENGKVNILGAGIRLVDSPTLPVGTNVSIVGSIVASTGEVGPNKLDVWVDGPEGRVSLVTEEVTIGEDAVVVDQDLPVTLNFQINALLRFRAPGRRVLRARYGRIRVFSAADRTSARCGKCAR